MPGVSEALARTANHLLTRAAHKGLPSRDGKGAVDDPFRKQVSAFCCAHAVPIEPFQGNNCRTWDADDGKQASSHAPATLIRCT